MQPYISNKGTRREDEGSEVFGHEKPICIMGNLQVFVYPLTMTVEHRRRPIDAGKDTGRVYEGWHV
jgi:hypothetical protein